MKFSKSMKKILLLMLKVDQPLSIRDMAGILERDALRQYGNHTTVDEIRRISYKRTLRRLEDWGLVKRDLIRKSHGWVGYRLTDEGKITAREFLKNILDFIREYQELI